MFGCNFFVRLLPVQRGICWRLPMGDLIQLPPGNSVPWHLSNFGPRNQNRGRTHRQPGQTAPYYGLRKGLCPRCCVCTRLIMIWKNVWLPFYTLWITNSTQTLDGASITQRSVWWEHGCFDTRRLWPFWGLWSFPLWWQQSCSASAPNCVTYFQNEIVSIALATGKVKRASILRATLFKNHLESK